MQTHPTPPAKLERIGRYRIVRPLSKGGMALVYEARRESLAGVAPRVAIKLILPEHKGSRTFKELFINEARLGASMQHQNLVGIQDFDCEGDTYYLVMEFVEGLTLRKIIGLCQQHRVGIPLGVIAEIGRQACDGLHYAHSAKDEKGRHLRLVHRDIKPSNVILNPHGVIKVLDFGISKGRLRKERQGSVKGTWGYMAPEQAHGQEVWPSADVFGLGVVLFELASLSPMFQNKSKDEIKRLLADDHAARMAATLDPHYAPLIGVLVRALQHDSRARFGSAEEFGRALSALLPDPITARDEVVRFFEYLEQLDGGPKLAPPPPTGTVATFGPSVIGGGIADSPVQGVGWFLSGAVATAFAVLFVALLAMVGVFLYRDMVIVPARGDGGAEAEFIERQRTRPDTPPAEPKPAAKDETKPEPKPVAPEPKPAPEPARVKVVRPKPKPRPKTPSPSPDPAPMPQPGPVGTFAPTPTPAPVPPPAPVEVAPAVTKGTVRIEAVQRAEVYIAGQFVSYAPVERELPPGRYAVSIVAMDGRRRTFEIKVREGTTIRRTWDFDRMEWR